MIRYRIMQALNFQIQYYGSIFYGVKDFYLDFLDCGIGLTAQIVIWFTTIKNEFRTKISKLKSFIIPKFPDRIISLLLEGKTDRKIQIRWKKSLVSIQNLKFWKIFLCGQHTRLNLSIELNSRSYYLSTGVHFYPMIYFKISKQ